MARDARGGIVKASNAKRIARILTRNAHEHSFPIHQGYARCSDAPLVHVYDNRGPSVERDAEQAELVRSLAGDGIKLAASAAYPEDCYTLGNLFYVAGYPGTVEEAETRIRERWDAILNRGNANHRPRLVLLQGGRS